MSPSDWPRVEQLFHAALQRRPSERETFLAEACRDDEELRREVLSRLACGSDVDRFPEQPAADAAAGRAAVVRGARLGPYEVIELIGSGGMGEVYRARDVRLGRDVAIKVVAERLTRDPSTVDRFIREAQAASRLNHPNILTIHEVGEADAGRFIVMELVQGRTFRALAGERPSWESVSDLGRQVAKALAAAHQAGIVHRDLKPENLMIRDDGYVKVLDFGLARLLPQEAPGSDIVTGRATEAGTVLGTPRYMAPEQASGKAVGPVADVFSLGLVLYELAAGRHPFEAATAFGVVEAIVSHAATPPSRLNPELPAVLDALLLEMLEKDPLRRPTAAEVDKRLGSLTAQPQPAPAKPVPARRSVGRQAERVALKAAFDSAAAGRGLLVSVGGEPGIGKTTLIEDFLAEIEAEGRVRVARGRCSERLAGTEAYLPWLEALDSLVKGVAGAENARLMKLLAPGWYAQVARPSADSAPTGVVLAAQNASQERMKREVAAFFDEASRGQPLVLFLDDLHWSDVSSLDLLAYVGTRLPSMRVLVLTTYRPSELTEGRQLFASVKLDLQSRGVARDLSLGFLSRDDVADYLSLEFPGHRFPADFVGFIHAKTEGSPLFLVGLVRDLRDRSILAQENGQWTLVGELPAIERDLPESIRSMIQRKIEQLPEPDRALLVAASVQGSEFDSAVVARALDRDVAEVEDRLDQLDRVHAFIHRVGEQEFPDRTPSMRHRFVHVLYQNVLHGSLTPTRRAVLSRAVALALVGHYGEKRSPLAARLALLFEAARDPERGIEHYLLAARRAVQMHAHGEAIGLLRRGLRLLESLPKTPERERRELDLLMMLGPALSVSSGYGVPEVEAVYARARELCRGVGEPLEVFPVLWGLCLYYGVRAETASALELGGQLIALAQRSDDAFLVLQARHAQWPHAVGSGDLVSARAHVDVALALYDPERYGARTYPYGGHDPGVCGQAFASLVLWALGLPDQALRRCRESIALAERLAHPVSLSMALSLAAQLDHLRGDAEAALAEASQVVTLAREQGFAYFIAWANLLAGWAVARLGNTEQGIGQIREGLDLWRSTGARLHRPHWLALLADALHRGGLDDEALAVAGEGLAEVQRTGQAFRESELHLLQSEVLLSRGDRQAAEACIRQALDVARRQGAKGFELRAATSLARLGQAGNRGPDLVGPLKAVYASFTEGFDTPELREAAELLKDQG